MTQENTTPAPFIDGEIENVNKSTLGYLKRHPLYIISAIGWIVIFAILIYITRLFNLVVAPIIIIIATYTYVKTRVEHEFMEQFASANNFSYSATGSMNGLDGFIFQIGHSKLITDFISGNYSNCPLTLFNYRYVTGNGKSQQTHLCTIFRLQFNISMPDILVENKAYRTANFLLTDVSLGGGKVTVNLEGDFSKYFTLKITKGYEIEALQIFTPDIMAELIDKARNFSLEIINGDLFIYSNHMIGTKDELLQMYGLAGYFIQKLQPLFVEMKPSLDAMESIQKTI